MTEKYSVAQISKLSVESLRLGLLAVVVAFACLPSTAQAQQFDEQEFDRINTELSEAMSELGSDLGSSKRKALLEKLKRGVERIRQLKQRAGDEEGKKYLQEYEDEIIRTIAKNDEGSSENQTGKDTKNSIHLSVKDKSKTIVGELVSNPWKINKIENRNYQQEKHNENIKETLSKYFLPDSWSLTEYRRWGKNFIDGGRLPPKLRDWFSLRFYNYYEEFKQIQNDTDKLAGAMKRSDPRWEKFREQLYKKIGKKVENGNPNYTLLIGKRRKKPNFDDDEAVKLFVISAANALRAAGNELGKAMRGNLRRPGWDGYKNLKLLLTNSWSDYQERYYTLQKALAALIHVDVTDDMDAYWHSTTTAWRTKRAEVCGNLTNLERDIVWALGAPRDETEFQEERDKIDLLDKAVDKRNKWGMRNFDNSLRVIFADTVYTRYGNSLSLDGGAAVQAQMDIDAFNKNYAQKMRTRSARETGQAQLVYGSFIGARLERGLRRALKEKSFSPHEAIRILSADNFEKSLYKRIGFKVWTKYYNHRKNFFRACQDTIVAEDFLSPTQLGRFLINQKSRVKARQNR